MRRKGVPCACNPCKGKNYVRAVNNVSPDPNGDFNIIAGTGIGIQQTDDDSITITNTATPQSFVAGRNIELNPDASGDISIDLAEEPVVDGLTVNGDTQLNGDLEVNGDIIQNGSAYETHAEHVFTKDDYIIMRDGAVSGLPQGDYSGFQVKLYDGVDDGRLVIDREGTARVGDVGDEQPLMTRDESADMTNGNLIEWDAANSKAVDSGTDVSTINTAINGKVSGTGNIGSDTKPIKIVNGQAVAVTYDLERKIEQINTARITYSTASIASSGNWSNQSGTVNIPSGSPYFSASNGTIKILEAGLYLVNARLCNNISQYEAINANNNFVQNSVHNTQIMNVMYLPVNGIIQAALYGNANSGGFEQYNGLNVLEVTKL